MILGDTCTRRCGFCNVKTGTPTWNDPLEPARVARAIARMGLRHAVITSVDRDDLPDKGASAFVGVIRQVRRQAPGVPGRGSDPRLPGPGDAAGEGDRRAARRLQPQRRGRAPPVPARPARLGVRALLPRAAAGRRAGRGRCHHQVGPDGGARARPTRSCSTPSGRCARAASRCSPWASTCARPSSTSRLSATGTRTSSPRSQHGRAGARLPPRRRGPAGALLLPRRRARRADRAGGRPRALAPGFRPERATRRARNLFPLKDNIPLARFPLVTVCLVGDQRGRLPAGDPPRRSLLQWALRQRVGPLRGHPLRVHAPGRPLRARLPALRRRRRSPARGRRGWWAARALNRPPG